MLRHRLVRQSALNISSGSDSTMPSPPSLRRRRDSNDSKMYRQLSSDSLDHLVNANEDNKPSVRSRRHSVACGVLYVDIQKPTLKSAFHSAVRRMSDACSVLSSAPSSTYNLSPPRKKEAKVILPQALGTFRQNKFPAPKAENSDNKQSRNTFQVNRRFSTDLPPPTYGEAVCAWKQSAPKQKLLTRQNDAVTSSSSLIEDDDIVNQQE